MTEQERAYLNELCHKFRVDLIEVLHEKQTGHPGGSLSVCEILTTLYFHTINVYPDDPKNPARDRVVLSKGHAAPMLYRVLAEKGFFPVEEMQTLRDFETRLQGHPCAQDTPGVELSTGPLGLGLSAALGMALSLRLDKSDAHVYAILGDGEINEGTIWEACMSASKFAVDNLTAILDLNGVQLDGTVAEIMPMGNIRAKFEAFGWHCIECDGHDVGALIDAYGQALAKKGMPSILLAHTVKGKGVSFMEGKNAWHGKPIGDAEYEAAMLELGGAK
ncbi:transketolase [Christensenella sp.]|uniref:transketolase n=1 Tax=Christensenella sp. TaxID=1935934 RepID=UPI003FA4CF2C